MTEVKEVRGHKRLPEWLKRSLPERSAAKTHTAIDKYGLNTVCESALCPNRNECYSHDTATFMILGNTCTRSCQFCNVNTGQGEVLNPHEPIHVAEASRELGLKYVVLTSVARDDLPDEGARHFAQTIRAVKNTIEGVQVEVLTPDFHARKELIELLVAEKPEVYNHNVETVPRLTQKVRVQAKYERSLQMLETIKECNPNLKTKSGLMLGLGETDEEVFSTAKDLLNVGVNILTLGQYLSPGKDYLPVEDFIHPDKFKWWTVQLEELGFDRVFSGPYVRSSYHAGETYLSLT